MDKPEDKYGEFWQYLSPTQHDLILEGNYLMNDVVRHGNFSFKDYSFLVFPYAKAYEGFLKKIFLDIGYINHLDYISDHFRLGKVMSPNLVQKLGDRSIYKKLLDSTDEAFADRLWQAWKLGRNEIFHYFPHNVRMISFNQAEEVINRFIEVMEEAYVKLKPLIKPKSFKTYAP